MRDTMQMAEAEVSVENPQRKASEIIPLLFTRWYPYPLPKAGLLESVTWYKSPRKVFRKLGLDLVLGSDLLAVS